MLDRTLKLTTPTDRQIVMTRAFDAPRARIWDAMTRCELLKRWMLGPPGWTMTDCRNDVRVGGAFRHEWRSDAGAAMAMHGVYRDVEPLRRITRTEAFDLGGAMDMPEQVATLELAEAGGRTTLTITVEFPSKEARDAACASGMEHGVAAGYERLDQVLGEPA